MSIPFSVHGDYHEDGSVVRTINGVEERYATQKDFQIACEAAYQEWLDKF